ncbi:unnamed protein product, partial [Linum tenue]
LSRIIAVRCFSSGGSPSIKVPGAQLLPPVEERRIGNTPFALISWILKIMRLHYFLTGWRMVKMIIYMGKQCLMKMK